MNINAPRHGPALALPFTKAANTSTADDPHGYHLPLARRIPDEVRNHFVAMTGEYVGTVLFLFFALSGTQVANNIPSAAGLTVAQTGSNPSQLLYIALCFGFSLAVNAWVFFRISGGLFNPAVTIGMCLIGALPWLRGVLLLLVQILGGITAAALVSCMFPGPLTVSTTLGGGTSVVQGLFIEMILTAELVFAIFMLAAEKHKGTFIAPVGIGLAMFIAELTGVYFTGGSLNPARSFGPQVVIHHFVAYHWIYWIGPLLGAILAAGFYKFIKVLEYETANPGQVPGEHISRPTYPLHGGAVNSNGQDGNASSGEPLDVIPEADSYIEKGLGSPDGGGTMNIRTHVGSNTTQRNRLESPAMGSNDQAYGGLIEGGKHGNKHEMLGESTESTSDPSTQRRSVTGAGSRRERIISEG